MNELITLSVHQRTASLDVRERLSMCLESFADPAAVALLTCHRVEVIAALPRDVEPRAWLSERLASDVPVAALRVRRERHAVRHLFDIALGLDSTIVGERQILGQLRRAYDAARARRSIDPAVAAAIQRALHLGREARATSALGAHARSVGSLAVDDALATLADPAGATVLVVGAGEVGSLAIRAFAHRVGSILVANRDIVKAKELAERHGGRAISLSDIEPALEGADVVISAADTRGAVLTAPVLARRLDRGPLVVVDIAVPRSVAVDARALAGLRYRTVDDLMRTVPVDAGAVVAAKRRAALESAAFLRELRARRAAPVIATLREDGETLRRRKVARAMRKLAHLSERDRRVVEDLSRSLVGALLHGPTVVARAEPARAPALRGLFSHSR